MSNGTWIIRKSQDKLGSPRILSDITLCYTVISDFLSEAAEVRYSDLPYTQCQVKFISRFHGDKYGGPQ